MASVLILPVRSLTDNRRLLAQLVDRDIRARYSGSMLGMAWPVLLPLVMLGMYTFVFGVVFRSRWPGAGDGVGDYSLTLFAGLIVHGFLADVISRSPTLILANVSFVKRVVFPLESLAWVTVLSSLFHAFVSLLVLGAGVLLVKGQLPLQFLAAPAVLIAMVPVALGVCWILSAGGVFFRDLAQFVALVNAGLLFLSPIFYPISALPVSLRGVAHLSPLAIPVEHLRALVIGGTADWGLLLLYLLGGYLLAAAGLWLFNRTRHGFPDVL